MKRIDEGLLETDLEYRFEYLAEYIEFGEDDEEALRGIAAEIGGRLPAMVDAIYAKFFAYDATWRHFLSRNQGGAIGGIRKQLEELTPDHEQIKFRKHHLGRYFNRLFSKPYDREMVEHLDAMGRIHRGMRGSSRLDVPLVQMNAFIGYISDLLTGAIQELDLDRERERAAVRAIGKVMWLQNDLVTRHYQVGAGRARRR